MGQAIREPAAGDRPVSLAVTLMREALAILDREGPPLAAATLSLAIEQAGGTADPPADV